MGECTDRVGVMGVRGVLGVTAIIGVIGVNGVIGVFVLLAVLAVLPMLVASVVWGCDWVTWHMQAVLGGGVQELCGNARYLGPRVCGEV